jgi:hypothetical protein
LIWGLGRMTIDWVFREEDALVKKGASIPPL